MKYLSVLSISLFFISCQNAGNTTTTVAEAETKSTSATANAERVVEEGLSKAYFASGCFWCVEAIFESVEGVEEAISGYAGGEEKNPTYEQVSRGRTNHTESVKVLYNPEQIDYKTLVKVYYGSHNPTTVNGQAPDFGKQYRSAIFYTSEKEQEIATAYKDSLDATGMYSDPIATEIGPLATFWKAEEYHQDYEEKNPNNPYIQKVSIPRLNRFKTKFPGLLKEGGH